MQIAGKPTLTLIAAALFALALSLPVHAQDEVNVLVARIAGSVEVNHATGTEGAWAAAKKGQRLTPGWQLRTGADSKVQLTFPLDNVVILKENTFLEIKALDSGGGAVIATDADGYDAGSLLVDIKNALSPGSEFLLETPTALAVVRGTKYAAVEIDEYDVTFYGYEGTVGIVNPNDITKFVEMTADTMVTTRYGEDPAPPVPSPTAAADFLADIESTTEFDAYDAAVEELAGELAGIVRRLENHEETLEDYLAEWKRYDRRGQTTHMIFLYLQALELEKQVDETALQLLEFLGQYGEVSLPAVQLGELLGAEDIGDAIRELDPDSIETYDNTDALLVELASRMQEIYEQLDDIYDDAQPLIVDNEDVYETLRGLLAGGKPSLWLRFKNFDTDNDGLSDVDEVALGLDPAVSNADDGFIVLVAPDDDEEFEFPLDDEITFEFEEMDTDLVERYTLVLTTGGGSVQLVRQNVDDTEDVLLSQLVGDGGVFADQIDANGVLEIEWHVEAEIDAAELLSDPSGGVIEVSSQLRTLTIQTPVQEDTVIIDLEPVGPTTITNGQRVTIRGRMSEVNALGRWEIRVAYDPTVLDFDRGFRLGLFTGSTVFFGDDPGGIVTISGVVPRGSGGISGEGQIFELEFLIIGDGDTVIEVEGVDLTDTLDRAIDAEGGDDVELTLIQTPVLGPSGVPGGPNDPPGSRGPK